MQAADNDDPKTDNVRIFYRLVGQIPESPRALFRVDRDSGVISVQADSMEGTAPQYTLTITAEDAKGDFNHNYIWNLWFNNWVLILCWDLLVRGTELLLFFAFFPVAKIGRNRKLEIKIIWSRLGQASISIDFWEGDINVASSQNTCCSVRFICLEHNIIFMCFTSRKKEGSFLFIRHSWY